MVRMTRKPKQPVCVSEDSFSKTKQVFEFQYQYTPGVHSSWDPNTDIFETEDHYVIQIEAAGLNEESLSLHAVENRLVVSSERRKMVEEQVIRYHQLEIQFMPFQKTIILPDNIDVKNVNANYREGMLIIHVVK